MTGEITLRGLVLPIGGLKEKSLAAHRAGIKTVLIPQRNQRDLVDIPDNVKKAMKFIPVQRVEELVEHAFAPLKEAKAAAPKAKAPKAAQPAARKPRKARPHAAKAKKK